MALLILARGAARGAGPEAYLPRADPIHQQLVALERDLAVLEAPHRVLAHHGDQHSGRVVQREGCTNLQEIVLALLLKEFQETPNLSEVF